MKLVCVAALAFAFLTPAGQQLGNSTPSERVAVPTEPEAWGAALKAMEQARASIHEWRSQTSPVSDAERAAYEQLVAANTALRREIAGLGERLAPPAKPVAAQPDRTPYVLSKPWVDAIRALGSDALAKREAALAEVRAALQGADPARQHAGLITLQRVGDIEYDKAAFRPLVLPYTTSATGAALESAFYALYNTAREDADLMRLHEAWRREPTGLKSSMLHLLMMFGGGKVEGRSEEIALEILAGKYDRSDTGLNGIWGAHVGPRLEARVLELSNSADRETAYDAFYYALSTFEDKSEPVVDKIIAMLGDSDPNYSQRALWGISHGVPEALHPKVANALVELHNTRSDAYVRQYSAELVKKYGDAATQARLMK